MTRVIVPDISFWQDNDATSRKVDFAQMKAAGVGGVILRAGQNTWPDEDFKDYYRAAKEAGLARGVYWYYDSRSTPMSQAILCVSQIDGDKPELGVWADLEESYGGNYRGWQNWKAFMQALDTKFPLVGTYTAPYYWMLNRPQDPDALDYFKRKPLWIAHYGVTTPLVPSPWTSWLFWQFTDSGDGLHYGVESREIDLNYFNGDANTFRNYFDLTDPPPSQELPTMEKYKVIWPAGCNTRPAPSTNNSYISTLPFGAEFDVKGYLVPIGKTAAEEEWGQLTDNTWVALTYNSTPRAVVVLPDADTVTGNFSLDVSFTDATGAVYAGTVNIDGLTLVKQ